jgi:hypothetical protein
LGVAGVLGLIALAFGEGAAARTAQALIFTVLALAALIGADILTRGAVSTFIIGY